MQPDDLRAAIYAGPSLLQLEPSASCNLNCRMCMSRDRPSRRATRGSLRLLAEDRLSPLLDALPSVRTLHLQGLGEPFLHPSLIAMITSASARGLRVTTSSNLTLLDPTTADRLVRSGLDTLHVSIDSADPVTYRRLRRGSDLTSVIGNLRMLIGARNRAGLQAPRVTLVAVLTRGTLAGLPDLVRLAGDLRVESVFVQNLAHCRHDGQSTTGTAQLTATGLDEMLRLSDRKQAEAVFAQARLCAAETGIELRLPTLRWTSGYRECRCDWPWTGMYLDYRGEMSPCCMTPFSPPLGNAFRTSPFELWNAPPIVEFRRRMLTGDPPQPCKSCSMYGGEF